MIQLSDILKERIKKVGGGAELGRLLGGLTGQAIGQYARGEGMPSLTFAVKWKEVFNENLIDLIFEVDRNSEIELVVEKYKEEWDKKIKEASIVEEPVPQFADLRDELIQTQRRLLARKASLIKCMEEKADLYKIIVENGIKKS